MTLPRKILLSISIAVFAACLAGGVSAGRTDDTLVVAFQRGVDDMDRLYSIRREALILAFLTDDGLFYVDPVTLAYVPLAASGFRRVDDLTFDVTVRGGVRFHDGSELSADDVVYTYNWMLKKNSGTRQGARIGRWLERVESTGPMRVRFHLRFPYPLVRRDMAISVPLRKKGTYDLSRDARRLPLNGLGPYRVVSFQPGRDIVLKRFDDYYANSPKGRPAIKHIVIRTIPDWGTQQAELMTGGVDWAYDLPTDVAVSIGKSEHTRYINGPSMRVFWINMDAAGHTGKDNPLTSRDVRRAINHAIDRESIVRNMIDGTAQVIHSACHPVQFGCYQDVRKYEYDPDKAKALLRKAGYPDGFAFDLWTYRQRKIAEAIMADLARVGIKARLRYVTAGTLGRARRSHKVQAYFATWGSGSTADASMIAGAHWAPGTSRNLADDPAVARAVLAAERTRDPEARKAALRTALKRIAEEAYWVPLYAGTLNYLVSPDLDFTPPKDGLPRLFLAKWK